MYALYEDDGPRGICSQDCRTTSSWKYLIKVDGYDDVRKLQRHLEAGAMGGRTNPRISYWFSEKYTDTENGADWIVEKEYILIKETRTPVE